LRAIRGRYEMESNAGEGLGDGSIIE